MGTPESVRLLRVVPRPGRSALVRAFDEFMVDREAMGCTRKTLSFYAYALGDLLAFLDGLAIAAPAQLMAGDLRAFLVDLQRRGCADTTVHLHARAVKTFCRWMVREDLLAADPMAKVAMPRLEQRILPAFSPDELKRLLAAGDVRERAVVLCLLDSGLRASEFVALNVGDVDARGGGVMVHQGKGRKDRVTFLGATARRALLRYLRARGDLLDTEALWVGETTGRRLSANGLAQLLTRLGKRAGVSPCRPHRFRRTFAMMSLRAGADLQSLSRLMGHAGVEVLRRYLDMQEGDLHEVHRRCSPADRLL